jgi:hypothetical protein
MITRTWKITTFNTNIPPMHDPTMIDVASFYHFNYVYNVQIYHYKKTIKWHILVMSIKYLSDYIEIIQRKALKSIYPGYINYNEYYNFSGLQTRYFL